ncbi:MAG TPA: type IV pilus biogenesis/stability protein PilW [Thermomonas sp.]|nr:type IV pilus biogenesis/stability protein PilW [Thermomonas sp.]
MRRDALALSVCVAVLAVGCSRLERLNIVKPTAERGDWTQVAVEHDVSDKNRDAAALTAVQLLDAAAKAYQAGKPDEATQMAGKALKADPTLAGAHSLLAAIATASGDQATAGKHHQQAVALAPGVGTHANNYGTWLCDNGRAAESLDWFERALADPNYPTPVAALANAGTCADRAGQADRAEAAWRQALALDPVGPQALAGMGALQFRRGRYLEARAFTERWLAVAPADADALQLASQIELKLGDTAASARYLHKLQALSPDATTAPGKQ